MKRTILLIFAVSLLFCVTACQPTPEKPIVVNKNDGKFEAAIKQEPTTSQDTDITPEIDTTYYSDTMEYEAVDHWKQTIELSDKMTVLADADILLPKVSAYPIEKLAKYPFTIEQINQMKDYFVKEDVKYIQDKSGVKTKADYAEEILQIKKNINIVENGGDGEDPDLLREIIKEMEKEMANAPDKVPKDLVIDSPVFDKDGGFWLRLQYLDGTKTGLLFGRREHGSFGYIRRDVGSMGTEIACEMNKTNDVKKWADLSIKNLEKMKQNPMDLKQSIEKAKIVLNDLNVTDMQFEKSERVLLGGENKYNEHALSLMFVRECGGIPSVVTRDYMERQPIMPEDLFSPPFSLETVEFVISESGVIEEFEWRYATKIAQIVTQNAILLPMDELKERISKQLYYNNARFDDNSDSKLSKNINIKSIELKSSYINVKDDPSSAYVAPVWVVKYTNTYLYNGVPDLEDTYTNELMLNAIDGGVVKMVHEPRPGR